MKNEKVHGNGANNEVLGKLQNLLKQLLKLMHHRIWISGFTAF